jgi:hypothetical protein
MPAEARRRRRVENRKGGEGGVWKKGGISIFEDAVALERIEKIQTHFFFFLFLLH